MYKTSYKCNITSMFSFVSGSHSAYFELSSMWLCGIHSLSFFEVKYTVWIHCSLFSHSSVDAVLLLRHLMRSTLFNRPIPGKLCVESFGLSDPVCLLASARACRGEFHTRVSHKWDADGGLVGASFLRAAGLGLGEPQLEPLDHHLRIQNNLMCCTDTIFLSALLWKSLGIPKLIL